MWSLLCRHYGFGRTLSCTLEYILKRLPAETILSSASLNYLLQEHRTNILSLSYIGVILLYLYMYVKTQSVFFVGAVPSTVEIQVALASKFSLKNPFLFIIFFFFLQIRFWTSTVIPERNLRPSPSLRIELNTCVTCAKGYSLRFVSLFLVRSSSSPCVRRIIFDANPTRFFN